MLNQHFHYFNLSKLGLVRPLQQKTILLLPNTLNRVRFNF